MRTISMNTYKVTFHYTIEVDAAHEDDAIVLAKSDLDDMFDDPNYEPSASDMAYTVELIDGVEPGQDD